MNQATVGITRENGGSASKDAELLKRIEDEEEKVVLAAWRELKRRDQAELRVAIRLNKTTGAREVVYLAIHEQRTVELLRDLYQQLPRRRNGGPGSAITV